MLITVVRGLGVFSLEVEFHVEELACKRRLGAIITEVQDQRELAANGFLSMRLLTLVGKLFVAFWDITTH